MTYKDYKAKWQRESFWFGMEISEPDEIPETVKTARRRAVKYWEILNEILDHPGI